MNLFNKHSMKAVFILIMISTFVIPACAQNKTGLIKGVEAALRNKLPAEVTSKSPLPHVPRTVTPRPTVSTRLPFPHQSLDAVIQRELMRSTAPEVLSNFPAKKPGPLAEKVLQMIRKVDVFSVAKMQIRERYQANYYLDYWREKGILDRSIDFRQLITINTPHFIPITHITIVNPQLLKHLFKNEHPDYMLIVGEVLKKADSFFFVEHNGKVFVRKEALTYVSSYDNLLDKLARKTNSTRLNIMLSQSEPTANFIKSRNQQICKALLGNQDVSSLEEVQSQSVDVTTQRTAQEIQFLVENLEPENPLRQAIEGTLKDNGYMAPSK